MNAFAVNSGWVAFKLSIFLKISALVGWSIGGVWGKEVIFFEKKVLTTEFHAEGVSVADYDGDGKKEIIYGPLVFSPQGELKSRYRDGGFFGVTDYANEFLSFAADVNADGKPDVISIGHPGTAVSWYENAGGLHKKWEKFTLLPALDQEAPLVASCVGDAQVEVIGSVAGRFGFASPSTAGVRAPWVFTPISAPIPGLGRYSHGLGLGDVNGDGRPDLLWRGGWFEQPAEAEHSVTTEVPVVWKAREADFGRAAGGAQMFATDVDGDGDADVVTSLAGHDYGIAWCENLDGRGEQWRQHLIVDAEPHTSPSGVSFSQAHGLAMADIDGDGVQDLITGKRWYAHNGGDPGGMDAAVLYWFRTVRTGKAGEAKFQPYLIDDQSGVGCQVVAADANGDQRMDIIVGSKRGAFVFLQTTREVDSEGFFPLLKNGGLQGFGGASPEFWRVEGETLIGESTAERPCPHNSFLIWQDGVVGDFELRVDFRISGSPEANAGIQLRSQQAGAHVTGYQADIDLAGKYRGILWDEDGRGLLGGIGEKVVIGPEGERQVEKLPTPPVTAPTSPDGWHQYRIIAQGATITLELNGAVTTQVTDHHRWEPKDASGKPKALVSPAGRELTGLLAFQLHSGPPTKIEYRRPRLKYLTR